jgi:hypothetical protein
MVAQLDLAPDSGVLAFRDTGVRSSATYFLLQARKGFRNTAATNPTSGVAMSAWVKVNSSSGKMFVNFCGCYLQWYVSGGKCVFRTYILHSGGGSGADVQKWVTYSSDWQHICFATVGSTMRSYRNGVLLGAPAWNGTFFGGNILSIDASSAAIDEAYIWRNCAFSSAAAVDKWASALYNSGTGRFLTQAAGADTESSSS